MFKETLLAMMQLLGSAASHGNVVLMRWIKHHTQKSDCDVMMDREYSEKQLQP